MNELPLSKRVQILAMLCEGSSMRAIRRVADVSINTCSRLPVEANAEGCHQDYADNNPVRYRFYRRGCGRNARLKQVWGS